MINEEVKTTTRNSEIVDADRSPLTAALKTAHETTQLVVSDLGALKAVDKELLAKITDLEIDLSDAFVNSQNIEEALAALKNCTQLNALRLKMSGISTQTNLRFKL